MTRHVQRRALSSLVPGPKTEPYASFGIQAPQLPMGFLVDGERSRLEGFSFPGPSFATGEHLKKPSKLLGEGRVCFDALGYTAWPITCCLGTPPIELFRNRVEAMPHRQVLTVPQYRVKVVYGLVDRA
jgi:hypothetical protein